MQKKEINYVCYHLCDLIILMLYFVFMSIGLMSRTKNRIDERQGDDDRFYDE